MNARYPNQVIDRDRLLHELRCEALHFRRLVALVDLIGFELANDVISPATAKRELEEIYGIDPPEPEKVAAG